MSSPSNIGFVYVLCNDQMPYVFKLGCTERSPTTRAHELSNASGVPERFQVVCYLEVENFQAVEKMLHKHFDHHRLSEYREFFYVEGLRDVVAAMFWHPDRWSFCEVYEPFLWENDVCRNGELLRNLPNPYKKNESAEISPPKSDSTSNVVPIESSHNAPVDEGDIAA